MPGNTRLWGGIIALVAIILIVLSLMVLTQQIQNAPAPTPSGEIPTITIEKTREPESTTEPDITSTPEVTADSTDDA